MLRAITDQDILSFLKENWDSYPSQVTLIQAAVRILWPEGPPTNGGERVVRVVLRENQERTLVRVSH